MKKTLRGTVGAIAVSASLLAAALPAGAFTIDSIAKNDLVLKAMPSSTLNLGGSSFDAPLVQAALNQWQLNDTKKNAFSAYQATKSGTGRANAISGAYNIGFSDFPLNILTPPDVGVGSANPKDSIVNYVQVPVALGGVTVIYHIGSLATTQLKNLLGLYPLTLNGATLGQIFAGKIGYWDSAAIVKLNPHLTVGGHTTLPHQKINIESRTAGSGTTFVFTDYLSKVDKVDFPAPTSAAFTHAAATNANSAALDASVTAIDGGIGYVEYGYALANHNPFALIVNAAGKAVAPTAAGITAAATAGLAFINAHGGFKLSVTSGFSISNPTGLTSYPIAGFSYAIVKKKQSSKNTGVAEVKFLDFLVHQGGGTSRTTTFGQDLAVSNGYAPMPVAIQTISRNFLKGVTYNGVVLLNATN
jgi:phosphate transport system substrate-binding protein